MRIYGKGERVREIPIHPQLRTALAGWLDERPGWPGAQVTPALFLNQRGQRLSAKGAHDAITSLAAAAGLDDDATGCSSHTRLAVAAARARTALPRCRACRSPIRQLASSPLSRPGRRWCSPAKAGSRWTLRRPRRCSTRCVWRRETVAKPRSYLIASP
ncbi:MAG: tyrosine-type recombinase/integrase [Solirubrobacteraceae bacterium]